jgi:hypothetical protein
MIDLSTKSFQKYYSEKNFARLFFTSVIKSSGTGKVAMLLVLIAAIFIFIPLPTPFQYVIFLNQINEIVFSVSIAVIGLLLVSFSILIALGNSDKAILSSVKLKKVTRPPYPNIVFRLPRFHRFPSGSPRRFWSMIPCWEKSSQLLSYA